MARRLGLDRVGDILGNIASLRPRLSRRKVLEASTLGMILVLAVIVRAIRVRWGPYMDAYDPLFQLRVTEYVVKNGYAAYFNWHDTLSWHPMGRNIARSSYLGVPFSAAFVYQLLQAVGLKVTVHNVCLYFPVLMGAITCIAVYFLGKELGGGSVGLFAAFFMAISEAFINRTAFGFFDTENVGIFGMAATSLFFLRSLQEERPREQRLAYAVVAGLFLGYLFVSWGAARYVVGLLTLFIIASLFSNLYDRRLLVSYGITMGVGFAIAVLVPRPGWKLIQSVEGMGVILLVVFLAIYDIARERLERRRAFLLLGALILLLVVGVFALESLGVIRPIGAKFRRVIDPRGATESPLYASVAEHKRSVWTSFFGSFGLTFTLGMLGSYFALEELDGRRLYCAVFFASSVYFAGSMSRLALILSVPAALMASYGLKELMTPFIGLSRQKGDTRRGRRRRTAFGVNRELAIVFSIFIFVATLPTFWGTAESSYRATSLASSAVPALFGGSYPQDWLQALVWMRDNLPEDAIVVSWWDYGYWIEAMANRTTLADGSTSNRTQIGNIGRIMMYNQSGSLPLLERYGATHVVVFYSFNPGNPQQQWPFGDNVKWSWMVQIGGLNLTEYVDERGSPTQKFQESTLNRLMTRQPDTAFKPVFASEYSFVLIYEVDYEAGQT